MSIIRPLARPATALAVVILFAGPAAAFEETGDAVADAFLAIVEAQSEGEVSVTGASTEGDVTTIEGFSASGQDDDGVVTNLTAETIDITGGEVAADGSMTANALAFRDMVVTMPSEPFRMEVGRLEATDVRLESPEAAEADGLDAGDAVYDRVAVIDIRLTGEPGSGEVTIDRLAVEGVDLSSDTMREGSLAVDGIAIPMATIEDEELRANLAALGYDGIRLDLAASGRWQPTAGLLDLETLRLSGAGMGVLTLEASLGGVTEEVVEQLQSDQQNPDQALALLNGITVGALSVGYVDEGLASRMIGFVAQSQGMTADTFAEQMGQALPQLLAPIGNQSFEREVAEAGTAFLKDPQSLKVTADPQNAVPIAQIVGAAMMSPGALPNVLGVTISANR